MERDWPFNEPKALNYSWFLNNAIQKNIGVTKRKKAILSNLFISDHRVWSEILALVLVRVVEVVPQIWVGVPEVVVDMNRVVEALTPPQIAVCDNLKVWSIFWE